ncbi:Fe-S protein assembly co-chaperone HscB [Herbaspirillum sp. YR522]|uniref:Fe-S protein assembly co-chaperone HscB n=1 Tax=Herbaspirillum sp. YR522 TaxID=1144342 RepID=UPI00026F7681|nr:Fe-S protein assembly co-chaperone HscB [Herbaspirillum sp. YR522]EJN07047.1 Fe-S protein assembly co-chaperone HscB [Herbaspirillum sp. YR522]
MQDHFALFQLPQCFAVDIKALEQAYHRVQSQAHPDKFVDASAAEKRVAMQWATRANEAYQTLKNPLKRARYLCELHGVDLQTESNTSMAPAFLMQQMEWRETLDDARAQRDLDALERLNTELLAARRAEVAQIEVLLEAAQYVETAQLVRQLMFLEKFASEIGDAFAMIEG